MKNMSFKSLWLLALAIGIFSFSSCSKSDEVSEVEVEEFTEDFVFRTQEATSLGRFGCYELVFPVTLAFPNGTTASASTYEEMAQLVRRWRANNPRVRTRPEIAFPYEVITRRGEVVLVENVNDQMRLRRACHRTFFDNNTPNGHNDRPKFCFKIVLPVSILLPSGEIFEISERSDRKDFRLAMSEWIRNNPDPTERPTLIFPINVILADRSTTTIADKEALIELKDSCK